MGKRNRERRREEQRRARSAAGRARETGNSGPSGHWGAGDRSSPREVESVVLAAAVAVVREDGPAFAELLTRLFWGPPVADGSRLVDAGLSRCLERAVGEAWRRGWQPADLARVTERRLSPAHARVATTAIAAEAGRYPPSTVDAHWRSQLDELAHDAAPATNGRRAGGPATREIEIRRGVETLALLLHVPELPRLCAPPGEATGAATFAASGIAASTDARVLGRVRALLAKAESTTFPDEAEALTTKAQELMARHAIDRAVLGTAAGQTGGPVGRRLAWTTPMPAPRPSCSAKSPWPTGAGRCGRRT